MNATIESMTSLGEVLIRFNTPMKTENLNITMIDSEIIDIYVDPEEKDEMFEPANLNLTWNITEYFKDFMRIQINFTEAYVVSPDF